ncbi:MAG TPA: SDR family oxidoreductase [Candidatus Acidoferrales bacterium]
MTRLSGKVALITGGGTGIGRACALQFSREGARVAVAGRRREPLAAVVAEIQAAGGQALSASCDVAKSEQVERTIREVVAQFGALHVLVNNAGILHVGSVEETSEAEWDRLVDVDLKGVFLVSRAALPELRKSGGAIVETDLVQTILSQAPDREAAARLRTAQIPLGRMGKPEDVAALAVFLASEESSWLTGAAIALDGGLTAY